MRRIIGRAAVTSAALSLALGAASAQAGDDPDLLTVGIGHYDHRYIDPGFLFLKASSKKREYGAVDYRVEYRFGTSLLPVIEDYAKLKPWVGVEITGNDAMYGAGGFLLDIPLGSFFFTPSAGIGLYANGRGKPMGSFLQFRTMLEVGYRFESEARVSAQFSHISSANLGELNPGSNIIGVYLHIPVDSLLH